MAKFPFDPLKNSFQEALGSLERPTVTPLLPNYDAFKDINAVVRAKERMFWAEGYKERIESAWKRFEEATPEEHTAVLLAALPNDVQVRISWIGYLNPKLLIFHGFVGQYESEVLVPVEQATVVMIYSKDKEEHKPQIGFMNSSSQGEEAVTPADV